VKRVPGRSSLRSPVELREPRRSVSEDVGCHRAEKSDARDLRETSDEDGRRAVMESAGALRHRAHARPIRMTKELGPPSP
jgi:hypothetical protein